MANIDMDTLLKEAEQKKKDQKESKKPRFEYKCSRDGKEIILPVELDRSRPIYCDDCIAIVREERKTGKKPFVKPLSPPKPSEGQSVEKLPEEPSITLSTLRKPSISGPVSVPKAVVLSRTPAPSRIIPQRSSVASYSYTCSDCTRTFSAGVKLDPSRSLYCQECLEKMRAKRKEHPLEKKQEANHPRVVTSPVVQSSLSQQTDDVTKKKRKRKRKNKEGTSEPIQEKLGTLKTGQTVHFD